MSDLVDQIEVVRRRNNTFWMDLLRLALEVAPERAKAILGQIEEHDSEVTRLLREIANS